MKTRKSQTKKFYNIGLWCQCYKTFFLENNEEADMMEYLSLASFSIVG
jgi:hypothetical protein